MSVVSKRADVNTNLVVYCCISERSRWATVHANLSRILTKGVGWTVNRCYANFGVVISVAKDWSRVAFSHTNTIRIVALILNIGIKINAYELASTSIIIPPKSGAVYSSRSSSIGSATGKRTLSYAYIGIVSNRPGA